MRSVKMTDNGRMDAHLSVGGSKTGSLPATTDLRSIYTARGEIEDPRKAEFPLSGLKIVFELLPSYITQNMIGCKFCF